MRKIVFHMGMSLDGYIEGPNRELDWHMVDDELHEHMNRHLATMGAFLMGRTVYELMESYWPDADKDPSAGRPEIEFAGIYRDMPKIVYSTKLERVGPNATLVRGVVPEQVEQLKAQPGGDLSLGGAGLGASFMRLGLIDEYRIYVHPVLVGAGKQLFPQGTDLTKLRLVENRTFGNGVVLLRYQPVSVPSSGADSSR